MEAARPENHRCAGLIMVDDLRLFGFLCSISVFLIYLSLQWELLQKIDTVWNLDMLAPQSEGYSIKRPVLLNKYLNLLDLSLRKLLQVQLVVGCFQLEAGAELELVRALSEEKECGYKLQGKHQQKEHGNSN